MVFHYVIRASAALTTEYWLSSWTADDLFWERLLALWAGSERQIDLYVKRRKKSISWLQLTITSVCTYCCGLQPFLFCSWLFSGHSVQFVCVCAGLCQHFLCCNTCYNSFVVVLIVGGFLLPTPWLWWTLFSVTIRAKSFLACLFYKLMMPVCHFHSGWNLFCCQLLLWFCGFVHFVIKCFTLLFQTVN